MAIVSYYIRVLVEIFRNEKQRFYILSFLSIVIIPVRLHCRSSRVQSVCKSVQVHAIVTHSFL